MKYLPLVVKQKSINKSNHTITGAVNGHEIGNVKLFIDTTIDLNL